MLLNIEDINKINKTPQDKKRGVIFFIIILSALPELLIFFTFNFKFSGLFNFSENTGVAFGFLKNIPDFVLIVSFFSFILISLTAIFSDYFNFKTRLCLAVMSGGALANLFERFFFGAVFDWIPLFFIDLNFNIADVEISLGALFAFIFICLSFKDFDDDLIISEFKKLYGENSKFRDGQLEAIKSVLSGTKTLVIQRTGWGKSLVYFLSAKLLRNQNKGIIIVVSPLLSLMENQMNMALKSGLKSEMLNSMVYSRRTEILNKILNNEIDLLLVSPETILKNDVQNVLKKIKISLFVIDEAHCISDWGHDFRLDYTKIKGVIENLDPKISILAETATANNRVIKDLNSQLGGNFKILKGPLTRKSLNIQILKNLDFTERLAWIAENINKIPGNGIIYCSTKKDCEMVKEFLKENDIKSESYFSRSSLEGEKLNKKILEMFTENKIKVIVATVKLGMGYDKDDISFVIHFNTPANIISWYQQIGRAGRNINNAYIFLMNSDEDKDINNFFIETAFPSKQETEDIINLIKDSSGITKNNIEDKINARSSRIKKALDFLEHDGFIFKLKNKYFVTGKNFEYNHEHYEELKNLRRTEFQQIQELVKTTECYSKFAVNCLDDYEADNCKKCFNCTGKNIIENLTLSSNTIERAKNFIKSRIIIIKPREKFPDGKRIEFQLMPGICISKYGVPGFGEIVKKVKYENLPDYPEEIISHSAEKLKNLINENEIKHITFVPSLRSQLVRNFTERLSEKLNLEFLDLLEKTYAPPQKEMENNSHQCDNAMKSFLIKDGVKIPLKIILVDDIVDSCWTLTICGFKLMERGCKKVFPFALANSSSY